MEIVLASTSRYRRELLERLNLPFRCMAPPINEDRWKSSGLASWEVAAGLAVAKAESLCGIVPSALVIGSDQVVECESVQLGKPGSADLAVDQLLLLSGRTHRLITAVAVCHGLRTRLHVDVTMLTMRALNHAQAREYVAADQPLDCAGSYRIESGGHALFESIDTVDRSAIIGLPLIALAGMLRRCGCDVVSDTAIAGM